MGGEGGNGEEVLSSAMVKVCSCGVPNKEVANAVHDFRDAPFLFQDAGGQLLRGKVGDVRLGPRVLPVEVVVVGQQFLLQTLANLAAGDVLAFLAGERRGVDLEIHRQRRFVDGQQGQGRGLVRVAERHANADFLDAVDEDDVASLGNIGQHALESPEDLHLVDARLEGLVVLGTLSYRQAVPYRSQEALWLHTIAVNPECFICHTNYGSDLLEAGRTDEAVAHLEKSLRIKPDALPTLLNLARLEEGRERFGKAEEHLRAALRLEPADTEVRVHLATIYTKAGRLSDAEREFREALKAPSNAAYLAHNGLGVVLVRSGRVEEGIEHLKECVRLRPDYERGRANLATVLELTGAR